MTIIFVEPLGMHNVTIPWAGFTHMGTGTGSGILVKWWEWLRMGGAWGRDGGAKVIPTISQKIDKNISN